MDQRLEERQGLKRKITSGQSDKRLNPWHESWMHLISDSGFFSHSEAYSKVTGSKGQLISHFTSRVYMVCHSGSERNSIHIYILEICRAIVPFSNYLSKFNIRVHTLLKMTVIQRMKERIVKLNNNRLFYWAELSEIDFSVTFKGCDKTNQVCRKLSVTARGQRKEILYLYSGGSIFLCVMSHLKQSLLALNLKFYFKLGNSKFKQIRLQSTFSFQIGC